MNTNSILVLFTQKLLMSDASTIMENVHSFKKHSAFSVVELNTEYGFPSFLKNYDFSVIALHYSLFGLGYHYTLSSEFLTFLKKNKATKVAFFQDDYRHCQKRFKFINDLNIDIVYTCLPEGYTEQVYKQNSNAKTVKSYLCGYIEEEFINKALKYVKPDYDRSIDISYRARKLPYVMGKGAQEKHLIGDKFTKLCVEKNINLNLDISNRTEDRIYGDDWYRFLANSKAILGVESGVSLFDLDGKATEETNIYLKSHPDARFEDVERAVLYKYDNNINYRVMSPRIFEAIALKCCLIHFEGNYSGIIKPDTHYIALKKDFSNFDEVIQKFKDGKFRKKLTDNAYNDIIMSDKYTYRTFISEFDNELINLGLKPEKVDISDIENQLRKYIAFKQKILLPKSYLEKKILNNFSENSLIRRAIKKTLDIVKNRKR